MSSMWKAVMNTCMRLGREASEEVDAVLERELPQYQFVISTGDSERGSFVDICYSPDEAEAKQLAKQFPELVPLDTPFSKEILAKVPVLSQRDRHLAHHPPPRPTWTKFWPRSSR